jgi:hypothetical protein
MAKKPTQGEVLNLAMVLRDIASHLEYADNEKDAQTLRQASTWLRHYLTPHMPRNPYK